MNIFPLLAEMTLPPYVDEIVVILIKLFGAALVALAALAVRKLGKKWGVEETQAGEERARGLARDAIAFADRWARNRDANQNVDSGDSFGPEKKTPGASKLEAALDFALNIDNTIGATEKARAVFANRIEAELEKEGNENAT